MFTNDELKNLLVLVNKAPISGSEATTVALLQQKLVQLIGATTVPATEEDKGSENGEG